MGTWKVRGDSIELLVFDTLQIPLLCSISYDKNIRNPKKETTFIIKDKTGKPIENFQILPFGKRAKYIYTEEGITENPSGGASKFDLFETDKRGQVKVNFSRYNSLTFSKLGSLTNRNIMFSTKDLPAYVTMKLNLNKEAFYYPVISYYNPAIKKVKYKLSGSHWLMRTADYFWKDKLQRTIATMKNF